LAATKNLLSSIRLLTKNRFFILLLFGELVVGLGFDIIDFPLIAYLLSLGFDVAAIGMLTSTGLIAMAIFQIPAGTLVSRLGKKNSILLGLFIYAVFPVLYPFCTNYGLLIAIAAASGIANSFLMPASFTLTAEIVPKDSRATAMTLVYFASGVLTFGPFIGAALYVVNMTFPFIICSLLTALTIVVFYFFLNPVEHYLTKNENADKTKLRSVLRKPFLGIFFSNFAYSFGAGMLFLIGPVFLLENFNESILHTGFALVIPQITCFILSLFAGSWMTKRKGKKTFLVIGLICTAASALAVTLTSTPYETVVVWTFLMISGVFVGSSGSTIIVENSEDTSRVKAMAAYSFFGTVGIICSMQVSGFVGKALGNLLAPFYFTAFVCFLAAVVASVVVDERS
jgi:MFS family permease